MDIFREHNSGKTCTRSIILTGTSDFGKVERTSATISGMGYPPNPKHIQISASRYKAPEKRRVSIRSSQRSGEIRYGLLQRCM